MEVKLPMPSSVNQLTTCPETAKRAVMTNSACSRLAQITQISNLTQKLALSLKIKNRKINC